MRILLTGASGQLGRAFRDVASTRHAVIPIVHQAAPDAPHERALDLADADAARRLVEDVAPDAVVHAAALTNVDACERDEARAMAVNARGTAALAEGAAAVGARFAYVSTDYVFDGERGDYREHDPVGPASAYGRSKLEGERAALRAGAERTIVARTAVVFGPHKKNFVTWLVEELKAGRGVRIVEDQRVSPTYAYDLAEQILALVERDASGVWHTAGASQLSRLEMAHRVARAFSLDASRIAPVKSSELAWVAPRPRDSTLDVAKISAVKPPLTFDEALARLREVYSA